MNKAQDKYCFLHLPLFKSCIGDFSLTASDLYTFVLLHRLRGGEDFIISSYKEIAELSKYSYPSTIRSIENLQKNKYLKIEKGKGWDKKIILRISKYKEDSEEFDNESGYLKFTYAFFDYFLSEDELIGNKSATRTALRLFYEVICSPLKSDTLEKSEKKVKYYNSANGKFKELYTSLSNMCGCSVRSIERSIRILRKKTNVLCFFRSKRKNGISYFFRGKYTKKPDEYINFFRDNFCFDKLLKYKLKDKKLKFDKKVKKDISYLYTQYRHKFDTPDIKWCEYIISKGIENSLSKKSKDDNITAPGVHAELINYLNTNVIGFNK